VIKLLVVDDSALMRRVLLEIFSEQPDFEVRVARDGLEALESLHIYAPDVITLDVHMPQLGGLECLDRIMLERPSPVVMVSSATAEGTDATFEALRLGAVDFFTKPDSAVSLSIREMAPRLVEKVRTAAGARIRPSLRLKDRVRHRMSAGALQAKAAPAATASARHGRATGKGLVLVGTSTGGPPALEALLTPLAADFPWPIVVAQHMPSTFTSALARRLDSICRLSVTEVTEPVLVKSGGVYIGKGDADVIISRRAGELLAMPAPALKGYPWHPSADRLVRTAMDIVPPHQLIGVLMTGMGNDGAEAMTELHKLGGRTIAESEESAVVWGMPGELVKAGGADWIASRTGIASRLRSLLA
jgi:two-component system, chemotaxis family, protein-glutamate methylesterase/glutaminase